MYLELSICGFRPEVDVLFRIWGILDRNLDRSDTLLSERLFQWHQFSLFGHVKTLDMSSSTSEN